MLTRMTDEDWESVVEVFRGVRPRGGDKGPNRRLFLEALHYFTVHNITWRALPEAFGNWNSIWKRFWRLNQMLDSTVVRAHVSAAGAKGGRMARLWAAPAGASRPRSTSRPISMGC